MWTGIALKIAQWFAGKGFETVLNGYKAKLASGDTRDQHAAELAGRELTVQQREIEVQADLKKVQIGHWSEPEKLMGYIMVIYLAKLIVWDKVIGSFVGYTANIFQTDPIVGEALTWAGLIILFYVGKRGFENVARILKR